MSDKHIPLFNPALPVSRICVEGRGNFAALTPGTRHQIAEWEAHPQLTLGVIFDSLDAKGIAYGTRFTQGSIGLVTVNDTPELLLRIRHNSSTPQCVDSRFERIQVPEGMTDGEALAIFGAGMCAGGL